MDIEKLEQYFNEKIPESVSVEESLPILYLVLGIRPGALLMSAQQKDTKIIEEFCDEFDLFYRYYGSDDSFPDDRGLFITDDKQRFDVLEGSDGYFYGFSTDAVGRFLGYKRESVDYFGSHTTAGNEYRRKVSEMLGEGKIDEKDAGYLNLISFVPVPEEGKIEEAIKLGKEREKMLESFDKNSGTTVGEKFISCLVNEKTAGD